MFSWEVENALCSDHSRTIVGEVVGNALGPLFQTKRAFAPENIFGFLPGGACKIPRSL